MKKLLLALILLYSISLNSQAAKIAESENVKQAERLAKRIVPDIAGKIQFEEKSDPKGDFYEIEATGKKIIIRGNSAGSMAVGLNNYLRQYCHTSVSWYASDPVELPSTLPQVNITERIEARMDNRFFLNYCTFGYTMTWWQWEDWERLIDWMAMNGVNMPLATTGQEAVWYNVWRKLGLTDKEIRSYFTGPAHLPWHRMTNIDYWQGGLPDSWLKHQVSLQKKIVARERELNMTPILPAFAGHVPQDLLRVYPNAKITQMSSWGGFRDRYASHFLDPMDSLFTIIQREFLQEQTKLYGTDHIYGIDPFNEIDSPSWEPAYLARVSKNIYESLTQCDPEASWLQMTWLFYFDRKNWTNPRIDAFVNGVPKDKMVLLDYFAENTEVWKQTEGYFGQPYLWCYLGNFGGNTMLAGNLKEVGRRIENAYKNGGENFWGIGSTLEALDVNPIMYEYVLSKAWNKTLTDQEWVDIWADSRAGCEDPIVRKAWRDLLDKVYIKHASLGQGTLTNARPSFTGHGNWTTNPKIDYNNKDLFNIWQVMLSSKNDSRDSYLFDVINIGRQVLGNHFLTARDEFTKAYMAKDKEELARCGERMVEILDDMNILLSGHTTFMYGRWIVAAANFGIGTREIEYYKENARTILTTWGEQSQSLNDYANRSWAGLMKGYYSLRWETFIQDVKNAMDQNEAFNEEDFAYKVQTMERTFTLTDFSSQTLPSKDPLITTRRLMNKYKTAIMGQ